MKTKLVFLITALIFFSLLAGVILLAIPVAQAQDKASDSANIDQETVKESVKQRLENSLDEKLQKVQNVLADTDPNTLFAYVGQVTNFDQKTTLTIKRADKQKTINFDTNTTLLLTDKAGRSKEIKADKINTDYYLLAMGKADQNGMMQAQRIVFYEESPLSTVERRVVFGKISEIDNKKIVLKNHSDLSLTLDKKTKLVISGVKEPDATNLAVGDKAVVVLQKSENTEILKAIFVWPGSSNPEATDNQINASASAQPATESGKTKK
ncbi:hypothetical protein A2160_05840 [Candidatus Beckwithbacteria bacterium RBG_13_42_9]|uniref:DUF5666 domain-containing protein n=1 Tax=Candidatus Beckwithbacteria bacterium RBG_13_42_9 TaxID=1797457 RepID=A0A1F5E5E3_9BACT|nr:MAG: hypothetical protein A2160_05840 [Candidatus Beckwithbacteria bacterium RBG_13_42_9]